MKILNLYAGIGGNRKLWNEVKQDIEVTAVELNPEIAKIYHDFFPNDKMIVTDAHEYLLNHFKEYDFIWSSPPCPTHSDIRRCGVHRGIFEPVYPDMQLYQEIILLKHFSKNLFVIENVRSYYEPLIKPTKLERHYFWSNFSIKQAKISKKNIVRDHVKPTDIIFGYDLKDYRIDNKIKLLRNLVNPEVGKHIFNCAINNLELF